MKAMGNGQMQFRVDLKDTAGNRVGSSLMRVIAENGNVRWEG